MDRTKILQLAAALGNMGEGLSGGPNTPGGSIGAGAKDMAQGGIEAEAQKKAAKAAEKKSRSSSLGGIAGTVAGIAAAPFTAGMSIPAAAAITGGAAALGSTAGQVAGGGGVDPAMILTDGLVGGAGGAVSSAMAPEGLQSIGALPTDASGQIALDAVPTTYKSTLKAMAPSLLVGAGLSRAAIPQPVAPNRLQPDGRGGYTYQPSKT